MTRYPTAVLTAAVFLLGAADPVTAQRGKRDAVLAQDLKDYATILKSRNNRKGALDDGALALIDKMMLRFEKYVDKDKRAVAKALSDTFRIAKRTAKNAAVYEAAVRGLGKTGKLGAAPLRKLFEAPRIAKGPGKVRKTFYPLRAKILREMGKCQDRQTAEFLLDVALKNAESDSFLAAAGQALGEFEKDKEPNRKKIAHKLIREFGRVHSLANSRIGGIEPNDISTPTFQRRLRAIKGPWNHTLRRLTRQKLSSPPEWQRFWNKMKDRKWNKGAYDTKR